MYAREKSRLKNQDTLLNKVFFILCSCLCFSHFVNCTILWSLFHDDEFLSSHAVGFVNNSNSNSGVGKLTADYETNKPEVV